MVPQPTSEKRVCKAEAADRSLKDFMDEASGMLWPEERVALVRARRVLEDHYGDKRDSED